MRKPWKGFAHPLLLRSAANIWYLFTTIGNIASANPPADAEVVATAFFLTSVFDLHGLSPFLAYAQSGLQIFLAHVVVIRSVLVVGVPYEFPRADFFNEFWSCWLLPVWSKRKYATLDALQEVLLAFHRPLLSKRRKTCSRVAGLPLITPTPMSSGLGP